jgi:hypothetical protein
MLEKTATGKSISDHAAQRKAQWARLDSKHPFLDKFANAGDADDFQKNIQSNVDLDNTPFSSLFNPNPTDFKLINPFETFSAKAAKMDEELGISKVDLLKDLSNLFGLKKNQRKVESKRGSNLLKNA